MLLPKSIVAIATICGLVSAVDLSTYQVHHKTPLGTDWKGLPVSVSRSLLSAKNVPYIPHPAGNASWVGMNFDFKYIEPVIAAVNSTEFPLITRGEAHVTVISPPEFAILATAGVTYEEVNGIAVSSKVQSSKVTAICLGKEDVVIGGVRKIIYQILVRAPELILIREKIFQLYAKKGGNTALFDPRSFWPHITVGFTSSDVFLEQGVYKGSNVCFRPIAFTK